MDETKLDGILRKVRKLIEIAQHESTPQEEARAAQEMADALMFQYKLDEVMLENSRPAEQRIKPRIIEVPLTGHSDYLVTYVAQLAAMTATHCDCRIRQYSRYLNGVWQSKVYGYESDSRYFDILYTELRLHMIGALRPRIDSAKTVAENAYRLHNAGLNWFDMAKLEGWYQVPPLPGEPKIMYKNDHTGERQKWATCIGKFKQGYAEEIARRGERWMTISPSGTRTFRENAAHGYINRIEQRLVDIRAKRQGMGTALALREDELTRLYEEDNPELFEPANEATAPKKGRTRAVKIRNIPYNQAGYEAGVRQANSAILNASAGANKARELPEG